MALHLTLPNHAADSPTPSGAGQSLIRLTEVSKVYDGKFGRVTALDRLTMTIAAGEFVAVTGPSGSGLHTTSSDRTTGPSSRSRTTASVPVDTISRSPLSGSIECAS